MIVLEKKTPPEAEKEVVALFGSGLIGSSICQNILRRGNYSSSFFPFDWDSVEQNKNDADIIFSVLSQLIDFNLKTTGSRIVFIWSAGKGGFEASEEDIQEELKNFGNVLGLAQRCVDKFPSVKIFFHLFSSAGGLFEGQRLVHSASQPKPRRFYGILKYEQEQSLLKIDARLRKIIYRPTSVYGFTGQGNRMGLIPTLILNGIQNKVTGIYGSLSTLRDYVFSQDIGHFVAESLYSDTDSSCTYHLLGTGKPSSIYEIRHFVEKVIGRKIYLKFENYSGIENTSDITLNSSVLSKGWNPTDLKTGIRLVKERIMLGIANG